MKLSQFFLPTLKEAPQEAQLISHQLMLRAGMIRPLASGIYSWLPLGLRVLNKVEQIVREEMNRSGAIELHMPMTQPAELWQESCRWQDYGRELLRFSDRHDREFCLGPTHEEVISDIVRRDIQSYRQLPLNLYQIQYKFRDEVRPRFGVMRGREFLMKDAYSFHLTEECLQNTYAIMVKTYAAIFDRLGLDYRAVSADSGSIGGDTSHEFHILADSGEDGLAFSDNSDYCANVELAESICQDQRQPAQQAMQKIHTPNIKTIDAIAKHLQVPASRCLKFLLVEGQDHAVIGIALRGDHQLNEIKAEKHPLVKKPLNFIEPALARQYLGADFGSLGPLNANMPILCDRYAAVMSDFNCGANENDYHLIGVNWGRDCEEPLVADLRTVNDGDPSPDGQGKLNICRGIEVGHVFQLGKKYSQALRVKVLDDQGDEQLLWMGCYGIGVSRIVAAAIEQNHQGGIRWPQAMAPWQLHMIAMNGKQTEQINQLCQQIYEFCQHQGIEVVFDDRAERAGIKFADADLIGCAHRLVIGDRSIQQHQLEYSHYLSNGEVHSEPISLSDWQQSLLNRLR